MGWTQTATDVWERRDDRDQVTHVCELADDEWVFRVQRAAVGLTVTEFREQVRDAIAAQG